jgi:hypothetical protein
MLTAEEFVEKIIEAAQRDDVTALKRYVDELHSRTVAERDAVWARLNKVLDTGSPEERQALVKAARVVALLKIKPETKTKQ